MKGSGNGRRKIAHLAGLNIDEKLLKLRLLHAGRIRYGRKEVEEVLRGGCISFDPLLTRISEEGICGSPSFRAKESVSGISVTRAPKWLCVASFERSSQHPPTTGFDQSKKVDIVEKERRGRKLF